MKVAFGGGTFDRADAIRSDPARLADLRRDGLLLQLDGLAPEVADGALTFGAAGDREGELVFLGLRGDRGLFAAVPAQGNAEPAYAQPPIWPLLTLLSGDDLALYGTARSVVDWHARHRFCAFCGGPTVPAKGGWQRSCPACNTQHFPRTDPVVIMLVEHERSLLLGRAPRFPPGRYSALAGFIEPGETVEDAVAREVMEEAGVQVTDVRYVASQPWPFPSQLMVGCHALARDTRLTIDHAELEDARWFTRDQVAEALDRGEESTSFIGPPAQAIAHSLLAWWLEIAP